MKDSVVFPFHEWLQFNQVKGVRVKLLDSNVYHLVITHISGNETNHFMPISEVWYTQVPVEYI